MEQRLVGYVRVAPRERADERPPLDTQRSLIRTAVAERADRLVGIEEDVRSGRTLRRPGLRAAIAACRNGQADGIIVSQLDRLTYALPDLAELVAAAIADQYTIVALDPAFDLATPAGQVAGAVLREGARWHPSAISASRRAVGRRVGRPSSTPAVVAHRIRALRADGLTLQAICDVLNADGIPTPRGGTEWRPTSLRSVLRAESN